MTNRFEDNKSIYERVKFKGLLNVVWNSLPLHAKFSLPYGLKVYKEIFSQSTNLEELLDYHTSKYFSSKCYRLLRPRHRKARKILSEDYGIM